MKLRPLLRRTALLPGESLASLLERLAQLNYRTTVALRRLLPTTSRAGQSFTAREAQINWSAEVFEHLAVLSCLTPRELYAASVHHFAPMLTPPDCTPETTRFSSSETAALTPERFGNKKLRPESAAQFCPRCLAKSAYHRLAWTPIMAAACLQHSCLLADRCPNCKNPVSVGTIVKARCGHCAFDLAEAPVIDICHDELGLFSQATLQGWLQTAPPPEQPWPYALPDQPPLALYHFLDGLCSAIAHAGTDWLQEHAHSVSSHSIAWEEAGTKKNLPPIVAYSLYATACRALTSWPEGFYEFLRAYALRDGQSQPTGRLDDDLGYFYGKTLEHRWKHSAFRFIQQAFNEFLISDYSAAPGVLKSNRYRTDAALADSFGGLTVKHAAQILGVGTPAVAQLIQIGRLPVEPDSTEQRYQLLRKTDVRALRERWDDTLSLYETARWLGLAPDRVIDLAKAGALVVERGPLANDGQHWRFAKQAVCDLFDRVKQNVKAPPLGIEKYLPLREASKVVASVNGNAAMLIIAAAEGKLCAYELQTNSYYVLNSLHFRQDDVERLAQTIGATQDWMSLDDIARRMAVKRTVIVKWVRDGLLQPVATYANAQHFSRKTVEQFATRHVFTEEAAEILGVGVVVVQKWARTGRLKPVASEKVNGCHRYLFRREEVECLRPENRLTAPQLAKQLGISRSQMSGWIRRGKVCPISGPGIDNAKHYLFIANEPQGGIS